MKKALIVKGGYNIRCLSHLAMVEEDVPSLDLQEGQRGACFFWKNVAAKQTLTVLAKSRHWSEISLVGFEAKHREVGKYSNWGESNRPPWGGKKEGSGSQDHLASM